MKTFILAGLLAVTAVSAAQPAAAIILPPRTGGCGMTMLQAAPAPDPATGPLSFLIRNRSQP